jgi:hypothetical protein
MAWNWGAIVESVAPAIVGLGTGLIMNNQNVQNAQGQANATQQALNAQYQIALQNQQNIQLMQQAGQKAPAEKKNNTALYIGLGLGGMAIIGIIIFVAKRK